MDIIGDVELRKEVEQYVMLCMTRYVGVAVFGLPQRAG